MQSLCFYLFFKINLGHGLIKITGLKSNHVYMISSFKKDFNELQIKKKPEYFKGLSDYLLCIKTKKHP